jgi:hypothetical protein
LAGTTTPAATYTSASGATFNTNPIVLDSAGRVPSSGEIWLTDGAQYKFVLKDSNDVLIATYDNIIGINSNFVNYTNQQEIQTATAGQTVFTLTTMQYQPATGSLSVFVDGVNQYGPGSTYSFQETSSTVVTFTTGLHVGASVKFTTSAINASSYGNASQITYTPAGTGAVATNVQARLRQTVSVKDFGAVGDGTTDDTTAFTNAATYAGSINGDVYVPPTAATYKLNSNPTVPTNVNFQCSPSWLSGSGLIPAEQFIALSEGVSPNIFAIKYIGYTETATNETKRKWGVVGWVNYKNAPASGYEGTLTDAVGVDGRGITSVANGRVWGVVGLGQLSPGVSGVAQAYAAEFDINNNYANNIQDSAIPAKGVVVVSGGTYRPEVAHFVNATKTPNNGLGDNRFFNGLRFYQDSCYAANIYIDDYNSCDAIRIPKQSLGVHWTSNSNLVNYYMKIDQSNNHLRLNIDSNQSFDIYNSANQLIVATGELNTSYGKPVAFSATTYGSVPASINAALADVITFGASGSITGGITGGVQGQIITLVNASGGTVTITRNSNMRTAGGASVSLGNLQVVQFVCTGGVYFQMAITTTNA